ncbi:MAG TPA: PHB depolymerase family esterase [Telluria sp.]|nr:PHB depolymerase family esterase [Telluria sp.]
MRNATLLLLFAGVVSARHAAASPAFSARTMARPEGVRHYLVDLPTHLPDEKRPTVILLHGHGSRAAHIIGMTSFAGYKMDGWARVADREGLMLIAPDGMEGSDGKRAWNDCRADADTNAQSDDVAFISALIDTAVKDLHADPERIYVYGSSNGGGMALRLGTEIAPRLAAIGAQSATFAATSRCKAPTHPVSVFITHGTKDKIVPYQGGAIGHWLLRGRGTGLSVDTTIAMWRALDKLPETAQVYRFPHLNRDDDTTATRYLWGASPSGLQVELLKIDGGGHTDSSTRNEAPLFLRMLVGDFNRDLDTAEEAWTFFKDKRASGR